MNRPSVSLELFGSFFMQQQTVKKDSRVKHGNDTAKACFERGDVLQKAEHAPYFSKTRCFWQKKFRIDQKQRALCNKFTVFIKNIFASVKHLTVTGKNTLFFINRGLFRVKTALRLLKKVLARPKAKMRPPNFALICTQSNKSRNVAARF